MNEALNDRKQVKTMRLHARSESGDKLKYM